MAILYFWIGVAITIASLVLYWLAQRSECAGTKKILAQLGIMAMFICGLLLSTWTLASTGVISEQLLGPITLVLAIVAILFAAVQFVDSRTQESRMTQLMDETSTRFIGFFPKNLLAINQIAQETQKCFEVMTDYVSYGYYSDPDQFEQFVRQIEDLRTKGVEVKMLIYTREQAQNTYKTQFSDEEFITSLKDKKSRLFRFCGRFDKPLHEKLIQWKEGEGIAVLKSKFDALMWNQQIVYLKRFLARGVTIKKTNDKLPFFFWCEDGHEAIFAFLHENDPDEREVSFRTRDRSLVIDTFEKKFNALWKNETVAVEVTLETVHNQEQPDW